MSPSARLGWRRACAARRLFAAGHLRRCAGSVTATAGRDRGGAALVRSSRQIRSCAGANAFFVARGAGRTRPDAPTASSSARSPIATSPSASPPKANSNSSASRSGPSTAGLLMSPTAAVDAVAGASRARARRPSRSAAPAPRPRCARLQRNPDQHRADRRHQQRAADPPGRLEPHQPHPGQRHHRHQQRRADPEQQQQQDSLA